MISKFPVELDVLVDAGFAFELKKGHTGSRMTGAGFGGSRFILFTSLWLPVLLNICARDTKKRGTKKFNCFIAQLQMVLTFNISLSGNLLYKFMRVCFVFLRPMMTFCSETVKEIPMLESSAYDILPKKKSINIVPHFVLKEKIGRCP